MKTRSSFPLLLSMALSVAAALLLRSRRAGIEAEVLAEAEAMTFLE